LLRSRPLLAVVARRYNNSTALRSEGIVTVEVGKEHVKYPLHKSVLVYHSEYFARALNGPWTEAEDRKVVLEDLEPGICK
jgi:hypothetical protein